MRIPLLKAVVFTAIALALLMAAGPIVGTLAALTGLSSVPAPAYAAVVCALLLAVTRVALHREGLDLRSLGLVPSGDRIRELAIGFAAGVLLFAILALVRGALAGVTWTFGGLDAMLPVLASVFVALLLLLPEELLFRGYAFQRLIQAVGVWPAILISAVLFGLYHLVGSGMWGCRTEQFGPIRDPGRAPSFRLHENSLLCTGTFRRGARVAGAAPSRPGRDAGLGP